MTEQPLIRLGQGEYRRDLAADDIAPCSRPLALGCAAALGFLAVFSTVPFLRGAGPGAQTPAADLSASGRGAPLPRPEDSTTTPLPVHALSGPGEGSRADQR